MNCSTRLKLFSYRRLTATTRPSCSLPEQRIEIEVQKKENQIFDGELSPRDIKSYGPLTVVNSAKSSISKFSRWVEIVSGFFKFHVTEDLNSKVGAPLFNVRLCIGIRGDALRETS